MTTDSLVLTLDMGTSSTRALLWDADGHEVKGAGAQIPYAMRTTPDGGVEMDADTLVGHVAECLDAFFKSYKQSGTLRAVGISTFWHSFIGVDSNGEPVTPLYNWADTRAAGAARRMRAEMDESAVHARTGCMIHPSYYPARIVWLRESQPDLYHKVARWVSPSEFLLGRFIGPAAAKTSLCMASGTGLLNQADCTWDRLTLEALKIPQESLPEIVDLDTPASGLTEAYASRWPLLKSVPFFPALGDGACGNVGSGCGTPRRLAINVGTSAAIRAMWDDETPDPGPAPDGLWRYRIDKRRPLMGAAFSDGGMDYKWMRDTLILPSDEEIESRLASAEPGQHGLTFLPYLAGERSPGWYPDARATLSGIGLSTTPIDILHATLEAVTLQFVEPAQELLRRFPAATEIIASGGALGKSRVWSQMFADVLGQPITLAQEAEASSRGAALLVMEAAGIIKDAAGMEARLGETFQPDPGRHSRYLEVLERQKALYRKLIS
jgi:gluconokinase